MSLQLWTLRHGKPLVKPGTCYGQLDVPADAAHTLHAAQALWAHWKTRKHPLPHEVWSSPLQRTRQMTAALQGLGLSAPVEYTPALAEMNFGAWEGLSWDDIGQQKLAAWTDDFWNHPVGMDDLAAGPQPSGESVGQFVGRIEQALCQLRKRAAGWLQHQPPDTDMRVLWVTHAGVIRAVHALLQLNKSFPLKASEWPLDAPEPGGWTMFELG